MMLVLVLLLPISLGLAALDALEVQQHDGANLRLNLY